MNSDLGCFLLCSPDEDISELDDAPPNLLVNVRSAVCISSVESLSSRDTTYSAIDIMNSRNVSLFPTSLSFRKTLIIDSTSVFFASFVFSG